jgi:hypothetical protein
MVGVDSLGSRKTRETHVVKFACYFPPTQKVSVDTGITMVFSCQHTARGVMVE